MPSNFPFDPFRRLRLRSDPPPSFPFGEEDSDDSSPERGQPRLIHVSAPKHTRSGERLVNIPGNGKISRGAPENALERTHIALPLGIPPDTAHPERPFEKPSMSGVASDSTDALQPSTKPTLMRRVTSKLNISIPLKHASDGLRSRPSTRTLPDETKPLKLGSRSPKAPAPMSPTLPSSFVSRQHREAALRERGLLPCKDLSEQEREENERLVCVPSPSSTTFGGLSEAARLKAGWLAVNRTSESSDSDCGPSVPPSLHGPGSRFIPAPPSSFVPSPDADVLRRSSESMSSSGRPSISSSVPPLSTSYLEVLHEDPSERGPVTPPPPLSPARPPIIIHSPFEDPSSPVLVESPVSCSFSSHCPGSPVVSLSQSDHAPVPARGFVRSPVSRRRTSDSGDRPRQPIGSSLSRMGTRSLSNLRRSVTDSFRRPSASMLSSADHRNTPFQAPRAAISPTMHSLGSILKETRHIEDAESRRLSELAFLD